MIDVLQEPSATVIQPPRRRERFLFVSSSLAIWATNQPKGFARDFQINDTVYRRLDPEYYAWLRSRMVVAKKAATAGHLPSRPRLKNCACGSIPCTSGRSSILASPALARCGANFRCRVATSRRSPRLMRPHVPHRARGNPARHCRKQWLWWMRSRQRARAWLEA